MSELTPTSLLELERAGLHAAIVCHESGHRVFPLILMTTVEGCLVPTGYIEQVSCRYLCLEYIKSLISLHWPCLGYFLSRVLQYSLCSMRNHQLCFLLFNVLLFHALLFGADFVEEYLLQPTPAVYSNGAVVNVRERARKLDLNNARENVSRSYSITNPDVCSVSDPFLLVLVFSSAANLTQRDAVRMTWGNQTVCQGVSVKVLFFLGSSPNLAAEQNLLIESDRYGDIIQGQSETDLSSQGSVERTILALRWVIAFCPMARFVLLTKDSVFVNLPAIIGYTLNLHGHPEDLYLGRVIQKESPNRDPRSPCYVSPVLYPDKYLPEYCDGTTYVLSQDVVRKVYVASATVNALVQPDVFVGLCAQRAGVTPTHSSRFSGDKHIRYETCCYHYLFTSAGMGSQELKIIWREQEKRVGFCSLLQTYYGLVTCKTLTYLDKLPFFNPQRQK